MKTSTEHTTIGRRLSSCFNTEGLPCRRAITLAASETLAWGLRMQSKAPNTPLRGL